MTIEEFIESNGIRFLELELPERIKGFSMHDDDGVYTIVVNSRLGIMKNKETAAHEIQHIMRGDNENKQYIEYA